MTVDRTETVENERHREVAEPDVREVAATEPRPVARGRRAVRPAAETYESVSRANRSLAEIRAREVPDVAEAEQHRAAELNRRHAEDQAAEQEATVENGTGYEPDGLERADAP